MDAGKNLILDAEKTPAAEKIPFGCWKSSGAGKIPFRAGKNTKPLEKEHKGEDGRKELATKEEEQSRGD